MYGGGSALGRVCPEKALEGPACLQTPISQNLSRHCLSGLLVGTSPPGGLVT